MRLSGDQPCLKRVLFGDFRASFWIEDRRALWRVRQRRGHLAPAATDA